MQIGAERTDATSLENRVFDAARRLFSTKGYYATTTREIALQAGTSEAGVFRKFPNKYRLLMAVYNHAWSILNQRVAALPRQQDPREQILSIFLALADLYETDALTAAFILINVGNTDTLLVEHQSEAQVSPENLRYIENLRNLCKEAVDRSLVDASFTTDSLTEAVLGLFEGNLLGWYLADKSKDYGAKVPVADLIAVLRQLLSLQPTSLRVDMMITQCLPTTVSDMKDAVGRLLAISGNSLAVDISGLRDFAERERYRQKDDVDDYLLQSPDITSKRFEIEAMFKSGDLVASGSSYLALFMREMRDLHTMHLEAAFKSSTFTIEDWRQFWQRVVPLADFDNAHAMYLSSDNWPFSVFHQIIDRLEELIPTEKQELMSDILTAGIQDPRTYVYHAFGGRHEGQDRTKYVAHVLEKEPLVMPNGVMPVFAFEAATHAPALMRSRSSTTLMNDFDRAVRNLMLGVDPATALRLTTLVETYRRLAAAKVAYDSYEYFGFYAFVRHYLILRCTACMQKKNEALAEHFKYRAATYQFGEALSILNN